MPFERRYVPLAKVCRCGYAQRATPRRRQALLKAVGETPTAAAACVRESPRRELSRAGVTSTSALDASGLRTFRAGVAGLVADNWMSK